MLIKMMSTEQGTGLVALCDQCGKRIEEGSRANVIWSDSSFEQGALSDVLFVHSLTCDQAFQRQWGLVANSMELDLWMVDLAQRLAIDWTIAQQRHQQESASGDEGTDHRTTQPSI